VVDAGVKREREGIEWLCYFEEESKKERGEKRREKKWEVGEIPPP